MSLDNPWKKLADSVKTTLDTIPRMRNHGVKKSFYRIYYKPKARNEFGGYNKQK